MGSQIVKQYVLVRHAVAEKRHDIRHIDRFLKAPFPGDSTSSSDGGSEDIRFHGVALGRTLVAARFAEQAWAPLYSNAASAEQVFKANASNRRLEVVWLGCRLEEGWFFRLNSAGKRVVEFAQAIDGDVPQTCKLSGVDENVLASGESGEQAVRRLCEYFEINLPLPEVRICDHGFEVFDGMGRPLTSGLRGYARVDGPEIAAGENEAATALAAAIESCDPAGIRAAIEQGAPLTALPERHESPLQAALYKFDHPRWKECVDLLIGLGCPINGVKQAPPIVECVSRCDQFPALLKAVELLLAHGADVNAKDRQGWTAIQLCLVEGKRKFLSFLLEHGADPNIKGPENLSAVERARQRYESETGFRRRTHYAEVLTLLTGEPVAKPQAAVLSTTLAAETERFKLCLLARKILALAPAQIKLFPQDTSPFAADRWFPDWLTELLDAGFQLAGHYVLGVSGKSAYTNPNLGFDAILSVRPGRAPVCEVAAYYPDGTLMIAANVPTMEPAELIPQFIVRRDFKDASPARLAEHLRNLVQGKDLSRVDAATFAPRYVDLMKRLVVESRERAQQVLDSPAVLSDGLPPRHERLGALLDFSQWRDPGHSSDNWVRKFEESFAERDRQPPRSTDHALDAAMYLIVMRHFQFATAPDPHEYLAQATAVALAHFQTLAAEATPGFHAEPWCQFPALLRGLLLCALAGDWKTFKQICGLVQPRLASAKTAGDEDLDFAQVLLLLVSGFREHALQKAATLERSVAKRLDKRPRSLLEVWRAIAAGRAADVEIALRKSLEYFVEMRDPKLVVKKTNELYRFVSLPDSLFYLAARHRGIELSPLPPPFADMLITPETIGIDTGTG